MEMFILNGNVSPYQISEVIHRIYNTDVFFTNYKDYTFGEFSFLFKDKNIVINLQELGYTKKYRLAFNFPKEEVNDISYEEKITLLTIIGANFGGFVTHRYDQELKYVKCL